MMHTYKITFSYKFTFIIHFNVVEDNFVKFHFRILELSRVHHHAYEQVCAKHTAM